MAEAANPPSGAALRERMEALGRELAARESEHTPGLASATQVALALHDQVETALSAFHEAAREAGAPQLAVALSAVRVDDKHLRAVQFDLRRGRHAAIVTVKTRGEVILVGPFQQGKDEGPCRRFPVTADREIEGGLGDFLTAFLNQAATP
jgi:hypothetical protein